MTKSIVFYTDNELDPKIANKVQARLTSISQELSIPIYAISLLPVDVNFGHVKVCESGPRGYLTMFRQILCGLEMAQTDDVFLAEHDVMYSRSHFEFTPMRHTTYYYNLNVWKLNLVTNMAVHVDDCKQTSGLCANRGLLLQHYEERVRRVEQEGFNRSMGFEPGTHNRNERIDDYKAEGWSSAVPIVDIRHGHNLTASRWNPNQFRNKHFTKGWTVRDRNTIPGWNSGDLP